jgi:hypothetical protein
MGTNKDEHQQGTDPVSDFHDNIQRIPKYRYRLTVNRVRYALFWAAGLLFAAQFFALRMTHLSWSVDNFLLIAPFVAGYLLLGILVKNKPHKALIAGLLMFLLYWVMQVLLDVFYNGYTDIVQVIFKGIILKLVLLANLGRPIPDARQMQEAMEDGRVL